MARHLGDTAFSQACKLIKAYSDVGGVIQAASTQPAATLDLPAAAVEDLRLVQDLSMELCRSKVFNRDVIGSWSALMAYVQGRFQHRATECLYILMLDRKNRLIADKLMSEGSIDHAPVYPREIARQCLLHHATAVILVHPHPSGDPSPSQADITMTKTLSDVLASLDIKIHDHVVVGRQGHYSFKANGLL